MRTVKVSLAERSYDILIGSNVLSQLGSQCQKLNLGSRCAIISDRKVAPLYGRTAVQSLKKAGFEPVLITVPSGETAKSLKSVEMCYDQLAEHRLERKSFIVALGGGVVGDLAGFVAATYLRGIAFVQVATTLLAQVDSSVGGKVGVNLKAGKNLVGAFYQPKVVLCDLDTLDTLPIREFRAGLAEVIKYGIIYDAALFERIERDLEKLKRDSGTLTCWWTPDGPSFERAKTLKRDSDTLTEVIARCCEIKADVVSQDETESGLRAILNFGHTIGHAIEAISGYGKYLHGEAISIGQVAAARLSAQCMGLPNPDVERIRKLFENAGLPTKINLSAAQRQKLFAAMKLDKKVSAGEIKFVLAEKIGSVKWGQKVPMELIKKALA